MQKLKTDPLIQKNKKTNLQANWGDGKNTGRASFIIGMGGGENQA